MKYPVIYSLSTVGVLKHYVHDYLFHPKRTDFVGSNGVGKSIIADLLQLIFVYDPMLIAFGTDGIKKEDRQIYSLPYKSKFAYCFINVEVDAGKFITMGIQINAQAGKRIVPFIISRQADLNLPLDQLSIDSGNLLFANDLTDGNRMPDLQGLAELIHNKHGLRLNFFRTQDEIRDYYQFLFDRYIVPINLSQDKNLKAYAKVIQSFSKAKALNLSGPQASKTLKDFLFEESDDDLKANFEKEQVALERIITQYKDLNKLINSVEEKQRKLTVLRALKDTCLVREKVYKAEEIKHHQDRLFQLDKRHSTLSSSLEHNQKRYEKCRKYLERLPALEKYFDIRYNEAIEHSRSFERLLTLYNTSKQHTTDYHRIANLPLLTIDPSWNNRTDDLDVSLRTVEEFDEAVGKANLYLARYKTPEELGNTRREQKNLLEELTSTYKKEKLDKDNLLSILRQKKDNSLLQWYLTQLPSVSAAELEMIYYFSAVAIAKLHAPGKGSRYVDAEHLLRDFSMQEAEGGFWIKLGPFYEFIPTDKDASLLAIKNGHDSTIAQLAEKIETESILLNRKLKALENISDAKAYDSELLGPGFDIEIIEASSLEKIKSFVRLAGYVEDKKLQLNGLLESLNEELATFDVSFKNLLETPELAKRRLNEYCDRWNSRNRKLARACGNIETEAGNLQKELLRTSSEIVDIKDQRQSQYKIFDGLISSYENAFGYKPDIDNSINDLESAKELHDAAVEEYKKSFLAIVHSFDETSQQKNSAVEMSVKDQSYSYPVLERALLGNFAKSTDDIAKALEEANHNRFAIADGIKNNMLKIFSRTTERFDDYDDHIKRINAFFLNRKISGKFEFALQFSPNKNLSIDIVRKMAYDVRNAAIRGELVFSSSIVDFLEDFFQTQSKIKDKIPIDRLLNPKTYFELSAKLSDQHGNEASGSTGESYSAIALLGIARLSVVQKKRTQRKGLRFIILEELGSLDNTNFKTFPEIAEEFDYQIITMAPHVLNMGLSDEWYSHHLIKGKVDDNINYHPSSSFFKTNSRNFDLAEYLKTNDK